MYRNNHIERDLVNEFENWVRDCGQSLLRYIYTLVRDRELSEDLYQETLLSAYLSLPSFEERSKLNSWIYKIAVNKCRDHWRKERTARRFWEEKVYTYEDCMPLPMPEDSTLKKCVQEEMIDTINELPTMYSEPIMLFYYHNQSLTEISSIKDVPLSTVKTRMRRAKFQLKEKVEHLAVP